jgi:hypothetical protein
MDKLLNPDLTRPQSLPTSVKKLHSNLSEPFSSVEEH